MTAQSSIEPGLWQQALSALPPSSSKSLDPARTGKRDVALAALRIAQDKRQLSLKKRWQIQKRAGEGEVVVRDVVEKIIHWIKRFIAVGDQIVQYDPGHAALPWAAFRFLLQVAINETTIYSDMVDDLEMVARLLAISQELEDAYLPNPTVLGVHLRVALVKLYTAILALLAKAVGTFSDSTAVRLLRAPFRSVNEDRGTEILAKEAEVLRIAALIDAQRINNIHIEVLRLADHTLATRKAVEEEHYLKVIRWLSQVPFSRHHEAQQETRIPTTGQWLVQHPDVRSWASASSCSLLLVHGIQGSGKTVLCSAIIDKYLDDMAKTPNLAPLAYFYCSASESEPERKTPEGVLRSLARQLTVARTPQRTVHSAVLSLYSRLFDVARADGFEMPKANISECIELILAALEDNPATLVVDALDEIEEKERLVEALDAIIKSSANVVKVFITSRDNPAMFTLLQPPQTIRITEDQNKADVRLFASHAVTAAISQCRLLMGNVPQVLRDRVVDELGSGAGGMFLWVELQLLRLCLCEHERDVIAALRGFATSTLKDLYDAAYKRIERAGKATHEIALRSFAWLLYAKEALNVDAFLLAIVSATQLKDVTVELVLSICRGFVHLDEHSKTIHFTHHSVREFLRLQKDLDSTHAHSLLAISCLSICNDPPYLETTRIEPAGSTYDYAVVYCGQHCSDAQTDGVSGTLTQEVRSFFSSEDEPSLSARIWMDNVKVANDSLPAEHFQKPAMELVSNKQCSPLFPICTFGLFDLLESSTWPADFDWDERNDYKHTPLYAASFFGHVKVVAFLLDHRSDCNLECGRYGSALHCAAFRGHAQIVKLLLDHGADISLGKEFQSAIHAACRGNQEEVVLAVLEKPDSIDQSLYGSVLDAISEAGFARAMEKLESHPLHQGIELSKTQQMAVKAIASGRVGNLKYLTRNCLVADLVPRGSVALSALHGHEEMTTYLLSHGLKVSEAGQHGTPLRCASLNGLSSICRLLISHGADVDNNGRLGSALHAAAMKGQLHIVKLLLDTGANVNIMGGYYGTPLQAAAYQGHKEVVSLLVRGGAHMWQSGFSKDAVHAAAEGGQQGVVQLLLASGFTPREPLMMTLSQFCLLQPPARNILRDSSPTRQGLPTDQRYRNRDRSNSDQAHCDGKDEIEIGIVDLYNPTPNVQAYVRVRNMEAADRIGNYTLEAAAAFGHLELVCEVMSGRRFLGVDDRAVNEALLAACKNGHQRVVEEIMRRTDEDSISLRRALQDAASHSRLSVVRTLLAHHSAAKDQADYVKAALQSSILGNQQVFQEILLTAERRLQGKEVNEILRDCLPIAVKVDKADIVRAIFARGEGIEQNNVIALLMAACKNGKVAAAKSLREALPTCALSQELISKCTRLAVEKDRLDVVRYWLPTMEKRSNARALPCMVLVASGRGHLEILELLLNDGEVGDTVLLQQALNCAAKNGHENICAYLLSKNIDPCKVARKFAWDDEATEVDGDEGRTSGDQNLPLLTDDHRSLNAIECCLSGFKRFDSRDESGLPRSLSQCREGDEDAQASTMRLLLDKVASLTDPRWDEALCAAVKLCPPSLVEAMLEKGANAGARHGRRNTLDYASERECHCFTITRALMQRIAADDIPKETLRRLLAQAFSFFHAHTGPPDGVDEQTISFFQELDEQLGKQDALLVKSRSLGDVFTTGPGAVIEHLLRYLPGEKFTSEHCHYSVLLQCAAAAGSTDLIKLLLDREVEVNGIGSYYGTALQAASRFGHADIVELLLEAGAYPNIRGGRHHTALRAAVLGGSSKAVSLLLEAGANTELSGTSWWSKEGDDPTPLQLAVSGNDPRIAQTLIAAGADINGNPGEQQPLFVQACKIGDIPLICALLEAGANVQIKGQPCPYHGGVCQEDGSGMHAAIEAGHTDVVALLLLKGFRSSGEFAELESPLTFAAGKGSMAIIDLLLQSAPFISDRKMLTSLEKAIRNSKVTAAMRILGHRPTVLQRGNCNSILTTACKTNDVDIIEWVLEELSCRGWVESVCTAVLTSPPRPVEFEEFQMIMEYASPPRRVEAAVFQMIMEYVPCNVDLFMEGCARGDMKIVHTSLKQGLTPSAVNHNGWSSLHVAARHASVAAVEFLLASGADPNAEHPTYGTPLRIALEAIVVKHPMIRDLPGEAETYARLLSEQADRGEWSFAKSRASSASFPQAQQVEKTVQLLLENGASPDPPRGPFGSCLALAAFIGIRSVFQMLLRSGANNNGVGGSLHSPLVAAVRGNHTDIVRDILDLTSGRSDRSGGDNVEAVALTTACETANILAVKLLLRNSIDCDAKVDETDTPLRMSLMKLGKRVDLRPGVHPERLRARSEIIVHLLLDADTSTMMTNQDLLAAAKIKKDDARTAILRKMIPRAKNPYFPEDAYISLIGHRRWGRRSKNDLAQQLLDENRVDRITTRILTAAAGNTRLVTRLLEYDPTYTVTTATPHFVADGDV